jgi:hypothetical protein
MASGRKPSKLMMMTRSISALDGVTLTVGVIVGIGVLVNAIVGLTVCVLVGTERTISGCAVSLGIIRVAFGLNVGVSGTPQIFGDGLQLIKINIKDKTKKRFRIISPI